jgi:hypothetical protein
MGNVDVNDETRDGERDAYAIPGLPRTSGSVQWLGRKTHPYRAPYLLKFILHLGVISVFFLVPYFFVMTELWIAPFC